ncbi:MAG: winged helix-turn-helix transcriptional regulator [Thermoguttaceae bacterium]|nr:winged helix-turn-helix transcriptional regulator [Thermoguttaceae bacterium]
MSEKKKDKKISTTLIETPAITDEQRQKTLESQVLIFKALGHPSRLMMVDALRSGPKCVGDLQELIGADMSTISKHLSLMKRAGVLTSEKHGTNQYYAIDFPLTAQFLTASEDFFNGTRREQPEKESKKQKKRKKKR